MPDVMQDPSDVSEERKALKRENKILGNKLTAARAALEAAHEALSTDASPTARVNMSRHITHTLMMTT